MIIVFDYLNSMALSYPVFTLHEMLLFVSWLFKDDLILNIVSKCHEGQTVLYLQCVFETACVVGAYNGVISFL